MKEKTEASERTRKRTKEERKKPQNLVIVEGALSNQPTNLSLSLLTDGELVGQRFSFSPRAFFSLSKPLRVVRDTRERKGLSLRLRYDSPTDRQRDREQIRPKRVARETERERRWDFADEPRKWGRRRRKPNSVEEEGEGGWEVARGGY